MEHQPRNVLTRPVARPGGDVRSDCGSVDIGYLLPANTLIESPKAAADSYRGDMIQQMYDSPGTASRRQFEFRAPDSINEEFSRLTTESLERIEIKLADCQRDNVEIGAMLSRLVAMPTGEVVKQSSSEMRFFVTNLFERQEQRMKSLLASEFQMVLARQQKGFAQLERAEHQQFAQLERAEHQQFVALGKAVEEGAVDDLRGEITKDSDTTDYNEKILAENSGGQGALPQRDLAKQEVDLDDLAQYDGNGKNLVPNERKEDLPAVEPKRVAACEESGSHKLMEDSEALHLSNIKAGMSGAHSSWQVNSLLKRVQSAKQSPIHHMLEHAGLLHILPEGPPDTQLAKTVMTKKFGLFTIMVSVVQGIFMGYEVDVTTRGSFLDPAEPPPSWFRTVDLMFTSFFVIELVIRLVALRFWFLINPSELKWNYLDILLVVTSMMADFDTGGVANFKFFRLLRVFRLIRLVKMLRVSRVFSHLRKMMLAIMASLTSLVWAFSFLAVVIFMFSIFFLSGICSHLKDSGYDNSARKEFSEWYGSLPKTMFALLVAISGGTDWIDIMSPLVSVSWTYQAVFVFYVSFTVIGVLNVLVGVFMESASDYRDRDLTVQAEIERLDSFVAEMLDLFDEFHPEHEGFITWEEFNTYLHVEHVEAYLSSHMLETTHARMLFKMLDHDNNGHISIHEFVIGMLRLRGGAKTYDNRVLMHELNVIRRDATEIKAELSHLRSSLR